MLLHDHSVIVALLRKSEQADSMNAKLMCCLAMLNILYAAPDDYTPSTAVEYTFTPGITRLEIPVVIIDDDMFEQMESFRAQLVTSQEGVIIDVPMTTVDILDNECEYIASLLIPVTDISFVTNCVLLRPCGVVCIGGGGGGEREGGKGSADYTCGYRQFRSDSP